MARALRAECRPSLGEQHRLGMLCRSVAFDQLVALDLASTRSATQAIGDEVAPATLCAAEQPRRYEDSRYDRKAWGSRLDGLVNKGYVVFVPQSRQDAAVSQITPESTRPAEAGLAALRSRSLFRGRAEQCMESSNSSVALATLYSGCSTRCAAVWPAGGVSPSEPRRWSGFDGACDVVHPAPETPLVEMVRIGERLDGAELARAQRAGIGLCLRA